MPRCKSATAASPVGLSLRLAHVVKFKVDLVATAVAGYATHTHTLTQRQTEDEQAEQLLQQSVWVSVSVHLLYLYEAVRAAQCRALFWGGTRTVQRGGRECASEGN